MDLIICNSSSPKEIYIFRIVGLLHHCYLASFSLAIPSRRVSPVADPHKNTNGKLFSPLAMTTMSNHGGGSHSVVDSMTASALLEIRSDSSAMGGRAQDGSYPNAAMLSETQRSDPSKASDAHQAARVGWGAANPCGGIHSSGYAAVNSHGYPTQTLPGAIQAGFASPGSAIPFLSLLGRAPPPPPATASGAVAAFGVDLPGYTATVSPTNGVLSGASPDSIIRKDKVEAALKSKPQRGRKRDNLSELERLELTRTRNREHAKSTRQRKKQRNQELLEYEKELKEMKKSNAARRSAVLDFFRIQEGVLRRGIAGISNTTGGGSDESAKSDETSVAGNGESAATLTTNKNLEDVIDRPNFRFEDNTSSVSAQDTTTSGADRLKAFDEALVSRVAARYGCESVRLLTVSVKGSTRGVALNCDHTGFAQVDVSIASKVPRAVLTAFVRFDFSPDSEAAIRSVLWTTVHDAIGRTDSDIDNERLISHPSVVSLEHGVAKDVEPLSHDADEPENVVSTSADGKTGRDEGPGMSI